MSVYRHPALQVSTARYNQVSCVSGCWTRSSASYISRAPHLKVGEWLHSSWSSKLVLSPNMPFLPLSSSWAASLLFIISSFSAAAAKKTKTMAANTEKAKAVLQRDIMSWKHLQQFHNKCCQQQYSSVRGMLLHLSKMYRQFVTSVIIPCLCSGFVAYSWIIASGWHLGIYLALMLNWTCVRNLSKSNPEESRVESFQVRDFKRGQTATCEQAENRAGWEVEGLSFFPRSALFIHLPLTTEVRRGCERSLPLRKDLSPWRISTGFRRNALAYSVFKCGRCATPATDVEAQSGGEKCLQPHGKSGKGSKMCTSADTYNQLVIQLL